MSEFETPATAENVAQPSEIVQETTQVAADTTETVAETDEQKNAREIEERQKRSERASKGIQKRFDELTAEKHYERQRAERLEQERAQLLSMIQGRQQPQPTQNGPQREQFADYESYLEAKAEWKAEQKANHAVSQWQEQQQRQAQQVLAQLQREQSVGQVQSHIESFAQKAGDDWQKLVANNDDVQLPDNFRQDVLVPLGPDSGPLLLALGKNPSLAQKFWNATPQQMLVMATKIVSGTPQVSKAPAPGTPVGARGAPSGGLSDQDSVDDWLRKRNSQLKGR